MIRPIGRLLVVLACVGTAAASEAGETKGRLVAVTVYRGQAMVTRLVDTGGPAGLRELVVTDLPENVQPGSIFAESADGVEVRSVRYRVRPVSQDVREEVRKLNEQIRGTQDRSDAVQKRLALLAEHKAYLTKLEQFVAPTATAELTKGVLNAETLKLLSTFLFEQRQTAGDEEFKLSLEQRGLKEQLEVLQRQRNEVAAGSARSIREAVVFVNLQRPDGGPLRLRYLVDKATWTPSYNVRSTGEDKPVQVEYYASIQQMTGEDWNDVGMTLSTATPSLVARAPSLAPLTVSLTSSGGKDAQAAQQRVLDPSAYASAKQELSRRKVQLENARNQFPVMQQSLNAPAQQQRGQAAAQSEVAMQDPDITLNTIASEMQILDLVASGARPPRSGAASTAPDEGVSVTYQLTGRTSMPSRSDQQLIQIASLPMRAEFYRIAIPMLTSYVYHEAGVTNTSDMVLLAGPVSAYRSGQFVGQGDVPTVAAGERFTLGFGIDTSLRARRELANRTESIQGGNRVVEFTYRLSVENFGAAAVPVRLIDRLPTAKENEVRIELVSTGDHELSKDPVYLQSERKKGLLRWEVEVPAQAIGPQALAVEHKLRLEYDKQMSIAGVPVASR